MELCIGAECKCGANKLSQYPFPKLNLCFVLKVLLLTTGVLLEDRRSKLIYWCKKRTGAENRRVLEANMRKLFFFAGSHII